MPFQFFISQEVFGLLKLLVAAVTCCFVSWQIRKAAQYFDGKRDLHHYVHTPDREALERGEDDGAAYYRRPLR